MNKITRKRKPVDSFTAATLVNLLGQKKSAEAELKSVRPIVWQFAKELEAALVSGNPEDFAKLGAYMRTLMEKELVAPK